MKTAFPQIVNISYGGGAGDILMAYVSVRTETARIQAIREKYPQTRFRAVLCTTCDSMPSVFALNPYFTDISYHTFVDYYERVYTEQAQGHPYLHELLQLHDPFEPRPMGFYLSPEETASIQNIASTPYVALHLFAGDGERRWFGRLGNDGADDLLRTITGLGWRVVLIGGHSKRQLGTDIAQMDEWFDTAIPGVHNALCQHTLRFHAELTRRATAVIGPISCFTSLASQYAHMKGRIFVLAPAWQAPRYDAPDQGVFTDLRGLGSTIRFWTADYSRDKELADIRTFLSGLGARV